MNRLFLLLTVFLIFRCDESISIGSSEINYSPELSIHNDSGSIYVEIYDYPEIAGFQFDLTVQGNGQITSLDASGGLSGENNFTVSTGLANLIVLGFSLTGDSIDASSLESGRLVYLDIVVTDNCQIGISNVILSGHNGVEIEVDVDTGLISLP